MKKDKLKKRAPLILALILLAGLDVWAVLGGAVGKNQGTETGEHSARTDPQSGAVSGTASVTADGAIDASSLFSSRDLRQTADLSKAETRVVSDGGDVMITAAGVYVLTGSAKNATVCVECGSNDKVQLVLDGLEIVNDDFPAIYVKKADKVFLTTVENSENSLSVTGTFTADGGTNTDAVIFSRDDLVLNGLGSLTLASTENGISCKDGLKITGGALRIDAGDCAVEANDFFAMSDGAVTLSAKNDGLHVENDDDDRLGWAYLCGGTLEIDVGDDAVHALSIVQIDGGTVSLKAAEGIEGTWVQINGGEIAVSATGDGVNGARKSSSFAPCIEIHGGTITVDMGPGDTDGIDSNGDLVITGGVISVNAQNPFDWDGSLSWTGGTVSVNGAEVTELTNQFDGQGGPGGTGGRP